MVFCPPQGANSKANRRQGGLIYGAGLRHLQEQRFSRSFVRRALKQDYSVGTLACSNPAMAQAKVDDRQLLRRRPMLVFDQLSRLCFAAQLNLGWHEKDRVLAGVDDRE